MKLHSFAAPAIATLAMTLVLPAYDIVVGTNHYNEAYKYYHPSVLSIKPDNGTIHAIVVMKERANESNVDVVEIKYVIDGWKLVFPK